jgi:hypothetical protein
MVKTHSVLEANGGLAETHFHLDNFAPFSILLVAVQVLVPSLIGNPVQFGDGPAAVIGDESCRMSLSKSGMGRRGR